jgi:two-component system, cell cycle sensor histidine kinase and response regulator CckA
VRTPTFLRRPWKATSQAADKTGEARLRRLIDRLPLVTYIDSYELGEPLLYVSPQIEPLLGYPRERWLADARFFWSIVHPDDRERVLNGIERGRREGTGFYGEYRLETADGRIVWVRDQAARDYSDGGEPVSHGFLLDITAEKRAQAEAMSTGQRLRTLVEQLPIALYVDRLDESNSNIYSSPYIERMLGYPPDAWLDDPDLFQKLLHADDRERVLAEHAAVRESGESLLTEYRLRSRDGRDVWVRDQAVVLESEHGGRGTLQGFLVDVTRERELQQQLRQSQKLEAVGLLVAGIAHDFNNLLTVINGYSDELLEAEAGVSDEAREQILEVRAAGERAAALTRQLLAHSKSHILRPEVFDLNETITSMTAMLDRVLGGRITLAADLDPLPCLVRADRGQIDQVVLNLAVNARDAMPRGGTLSLATRRSVDGSNVLLRIADTGVGMDTETRSRIFEPFYTTKAPGEGTGLGLSTVLGIVEQSHGTITLTSEPGVGTAFEILLPRAAGEAAKAETAKPAPSALGTASILLVEDDPFVRQFVHTALDRTGYAVTAVSCPAAAIEASAEKTFDVLVTDVVMPDMRGTELAAALLVHQPHLRVVYISGYPGAVPAGAEGAGEAKVILLQKPFRLEQLTDAIREVLAGRAG